MPLHRPLKRPSKPTPYKKPKETYRKFFRSLSRGSMKRGTMKSGSGSDTLPMWTELMSSLPIADSASSIQTGRPDSFSHTIRSRSSSPAEVYEVDVYPDHLLIWRRRQGMPHRYSLSPIWLKKIERLCKDWDREQVGDHSRITIYRRPTKPFEIHYSRGKKNESAKKV